ncbi:MAG: TonB-dependent receptor [PVC group bacterium]|nr:TonB-dependent receptor [PVC group bacterium]
MEIEDNYKQLTGEELLFLDITVITPARKEQCIIESPSAIYVITSEEIKHLESITFGDIFRMVPGVHFGHTNSAYTLVGGIRGFHKLPAQKAVLLINGELWKDESYAVPDIQLPISYKEIERIEILKGPGSSLYGPNAMFGVINIITKKPEDTHGNLFSVTGGENDTYIVTFLHGGQLKNKIDYRLTLEGNQIGNRDYIALASDPVLQQYKINTTIDYEINSNSKLSLFASHGYSEKKDIIVQSGVLPLREAEAHKISLVYNLHNPNIVIRAYARMSNKPKIFYGDSPEMGSKFIDFQHILEPFAKHTIMWGINIGDEFTDAEGYGGRREHKLSGLFLDNTYEINEKTILNGGFRFDKHSKVDNTLSHRISLQFFPNNISGFRFTWGTSCRNPDFGETYLDANFKIDPLYYIHITGNEDLKPEKASVFELGYRTQPTLKCFVDINLFYSKVNNFIHVIGTNQYSYNASLGGTVIEIPQVNLGIAQQYGTELEIRYKFSEYLDGIINYTYLKQKALDNNIADVLVMTPKHMANIQLKAKLKNNLAIVSSMHYKSSTDWIELLWEDLEMDRGNTTSGGHADSYVFFNLKLNYPLTNNAEFVLSCFNLFNTRFDDFPLDTSDIARRVTGSFNIKL